jgi:MipA family protein
MAFGLYILLASLSAVAAQDLDLTATPVPEPPKSSGFLGQGVTINLGAGAALSPSYEGSKSLKGSALPYIDINGLLHDRVSISVTHGVAVNVIDFNNFKAGVNISYAGGRGRMDGGRLNGLPNINGAAVLSGFMTYDFHPFSVGLSVNSRLGPTAGTTVSLGGDYTFHPLQKL